MEEMETVIYNRKPNEEWKDIHVEQIRRWEEKVCHKVSWWCLLETKQIIDNFF